MPQTSWITSTKERPRCRLFCFPYAGGGAQIYRHWARNLPVDLDVCPVRLPGRENRIIEPSYTQLSPLIDTLARELQPYFDVPFIFFGHSLGALVSFELARYLRRNNLPQPQMLLLSAHRAPQLPHKGQIVHALPKTEFVEALRTLGGTPEEVLHHAELMEMLMPTLRADFTVFETYVYTEEPPFTYPLTVFGGEQDNKVSRQDLAAWQQHTQGPFELHMFSGNHFYIHPCQDQLLSILTSSIEKHIR